MEEAVSEILKRLEDMEKRIETLEEELKYLKYHVYDSEVFE